MKKLLLLLLVFPLIGFCQSKSFKNSGIDNYKYFVVETTTYKNSRKIIIKELKKSGYNVLDVNDKYPKDLEQNPDLALYISSEEACGYSTCEANFYLNTFDGASFYSYGWQGSLSSGIAIKRAMRQMLSYRHNYKPRTTTSQIIDTKLSAELNFSSEKLRLAKLAKQKEDEAEVRDLDVSGKRAEMKSKVQSQLAKKENIFPGMTSTDPWEYKRSDKSGHWHGRKKLIRCHHRPKDLRRL